MLDQLSAGKYLQSAKTLNSPRTISVVTPTFRRPREAVELLENLSHQVLLPNEVIIVDATPFIDQEQLLIDSHKFPFAIKHVREDRGTARQRNAGIELANGDLVAFIDDDVRLEPDFLLQITKVFDGDPASEIGGVVGYRSNQHFRAETRSRWRWYRRLHLLKTYEPGRYDFETGYPINNNMQPPFTGVRDVDFMTTACAVWRRDVFERGLRFDYFFEDYGVLEDAHMSLHAGRDWKLVQCGDAHCRELRSPNGRTSRAVIGLKSVVNYYYVFRDIAGPLSIGQRLRFWRFQMFEFFRISTSVIRRGSWDDAQDLAGRVRGILMVLRGATK